MSTSLPPQNILAIQYSEFDVDIGPVIYYETAQTDFSNKRLFGSIQNFVCPHKSLENRFIVLKINQQKLIGCPVIIQADKTHSYPRNQFRFNVCFVVPAEADALKYEVAVRKLAKYLSMLETNHGFLYNCELKRNHLSAALDIIVRDINEKGQCSVKIYESVYINLKLLEKREDPPTVKIVDVPMFCKNIDLDHIEQMDLMTQQLIGRIDGFNHVQKIAALTDTETDLVQTTMENLLYYEIIKLVPIFLYKNRYIVTPEIRELYSNSERQKELAFFTVRKGCKELPTFYDIFQMVCAFDHGSKVKDITNKLKLTNIDEKKLVQYCVLKGYLRRVRQYPILLYDVNESISNGEKMLNTKNGKKSFKEFCDGTNDMDNIQCASTDSRLNSMNRKQQSYDAFSNRKYQINDLPLLTLWK